MLRAAVAAAALLASQGCLVLSVHPSHDRDALVWEPALVGDWKNTDDRVSVKIERSDWQSYKIAYVHPIEKGELTGYLTRIGETRYLDVMPVRGQDRGSFLVPVHATLKVVLDGDRLEVSALSYDWFFDRLTKGSGVAGLRTAFDEKENALIVSPTGRLREWLRTLPAGSPAFGAAAVFQRVMDVTVPNK